MTKAAKELHLTQSGVSQQIKSLEDSLQITLFDRINRRIIPTSEAEMLYNECSRRLDDLEAVLSQISNQDGELTGKVRIGLPSIFGHQTIMTIVAGLSKDFPNIRLDLRSGSPSQILSLMHKGQLDFAFVDSVLADTAIDQQLLTSESLDMICHTNLMDEYGPYQHSIEFFTQIPLISYAENKNLINSWIQSNFARSINSLNIRSIVMDCNIAANLAQSAIGAALLPSDMAQTISETQKEMVILQSQATVTNNISMASLNRRTMGPAARACYEWILQTLVQV